MANLKIIMRPEGSNDYADKLHPETVASQVIEETNKKFMTDAERTKLSGLPSSAVSKTGDTMTAPLFINAGFTSTEADTPSHDKATLKGYYSANNNWGGLGWFTSGNPFIAGLNGNLLVFNTSSGVKNAVWHSGNTPKITVATTAPVSPKVNDIWIQI